MVLTDRGEQVVLRVTDTGPGIPESELGQVFDRFHRVHSGDARDIQGTGVGLTLVAEAARAMGGTARVESELGVGSTFEVALPLVPTGAEHDLGLEARAQGRPRPRRRRRPLGRRRGRAGRRRSPAR